MILASAAACFAMYGVWAAAERRLQAESRDVPVFIEFAWYAMRACAAGIGLAAFMTFIFGLLGTALGTWIS